MTGSNDAHEGSMEGSNDENEDMSSEQSESDVDMGEMEYEEVNMPCALHPNLKDDIREARDLYGDDELDTPSVQIHETSTNLMYISAVVLNFPLEDIPDRLRVLWDLNDTATITMTFDNIHRGQFRTYGELPKITVKKHSWDDAPFIVGEQLKNFALRLCQDSFYRSTNDSPVQVGSFFKDVYGQIQQRLNRISEYCLSCGDILSSGGVLPSICDKDLCLYQHQELRLFVGLSVPRVSPDVLSLLLFAFSNANLSSRRSYILTPAPPIKDMVHLLQEAQTKLSEKMGEVGGAGDQLQATTGNYGMNGSANWNHTVRTATARNAIHSVESAAISVLLENLPCPKEFLANVSSYHQFRKDSPQMAHIVDWLVITNRSYLEMVPRTVNVDFLYTNSQYCFVSDTPAKQAVFDQLVAEYGGNTRFFFHGSPLENWHSIIRSGLKNMSGSHLQLNGAAHGKGIYLTPFLDFALNYATRSVGLLHTRKDGNGAMSYDRPIRSDCNQSACCETEREEDLSCVALVEVVDCPDAYRGNGGDIFVVEHEEWCSIRMLLLYRKSDIDSLHEALREDRHSRASSFSSRRMPSRRSLPAIASSAAQGGASSATGYGRPPNPFTRHTTGSGSGLMLYMKNKFASFSGGYSGSGPSSTASTQMSNLMGQVPAAAKGGSRELIAKLAEAKKLEKEEWKKEAQNAATGSAATSRPAQYSLPTDAAASSSGPATIGTAFSSDPTTIGTASSSDPTTIGTASSSDPTTIGTASSSSSSNVLIDLMRDDQPGTSGMQKYHERERKKRVAEAHGDEKDALSPSKSVADMNEWTEMSEMWRMEKERRNLKKTDDDETKETEKKEKSEKDSTKRKRSLSDASGEVPHKTTSSPSNNKTDEKLTEEDLAIFEKFADSDEDDVLWKKVVKGRDRKKKESTGKVEKKEQDKDAPGPSNTMQPYASPANLDYTAPPSIWNLPLPTRSTSLGSGGRPPLPPLPSQLAPSASLSSALNLPPSSAAQPSPQMLKTQAAILALMQEQRDLIQTSPSHARKHAMLAQLQQSMMAMHQQAPPPMLPPPLVPPTSMAAPLAPPPPGLGLGIGSFIQPPPGFSGSFLQMMGGMLAIPRRSRRCSGDTTPIPGDLTAITAEQRDQIHRVVRMFRESGFEERVNRHMNRDDKEEEEEEELEGEADGEEEKEVEADDDLERFDI